MTTLTLPTTSAQPRTLLGTTLIASTIAFSGIALAHPTIAKAEPGEWDIDAYDKCMAEPADPHLSALAHVAYCCIISGGQSDSTQTKCVAPAGNAQGPQKAPTTSAPPANNVPIHANPPAAR